MRDRRGLDASVFPPAAAWWTDGAGEFIAFSPRWEMWTGRDLARELRKGWLDAVHPEDRSVWERVYGRALGSGREFRCDLRLLTADGWSWVRMHGVPQPDGAGRFAGFAGSATDVSDLKRASAELEDLVRSALHDLGAPLRNLGHVLEQLEPSAAQHELVERARDQARSLEDLLRDLREYSALGHSGAGAQVVDAAEAFAWARSNLEPLIAQMRAEIAVGPLPRVWADPIHVGRVFQNLLSNALLYSGDAPPRIAVGAQREALEVCFAVQDQGMGIPPDAHETIFRAFERLPGGRVPGTGLGLAICRKLVELHGGRIWVDSRPGSGSVFYFTLTAAE